MMGDAMMDDGPAAAVEGVDTMRLSSRTDSGLVDEPLEDAAVSGGGGTADADALTVEVFDPQQHGKGRKRYTSYCILVRDVRHDNKSRAAVRRRYTAFQWLYRHLQEERPGAAVPILPHRKALTSEERFSDDLISYRRECGEVWLNRIIRHPELRGAPCLTEFFGAEDTLFAAAREKEESEERGGVAGADTEDGGEDESGHGTNGGSDDGRADDSEREEEASSSGGGGTGAESDDKSEMASSTASAEEDSPSKVGRERFHRIKKLATKLSTKLAISAASNELEKSPDEYAFVQMEEWAAAAESTARGLEKHARAFRASVRERGRLLESSGAKFAVAGALPFPVCSAAQSEPLQAIMKKAGESSSNLGLVEGERADTLKAKGDGLIQELLRDVQSFRNALQRRREVQVDYTARVNGVDSRRRTLETVRGYPTQKAVNKAQQAEFEREAELQLEEGKRVAAERKRLFEECCERVKREAERTRARFRDQVREVVRTLAEVQMEYNMKAGEAWGELQGSMEYMEVVGSNAGGGGGGEETW